jgi:hypothetical protein
MVVVQVASRGHITFAGKIIPLKVFIAKNLSRDYLCYNDVKRSIFFSSKDAGKFKLFLLT